jgi:AcrR family transcriptional regulator
VPKLIDHARRREDLAEAVWRVIARAGVGAVSVRTVAAEAGVSTGSLRHVLPSKGVMLAAAMELVIERGTRRFLDRPHDVTSRAAALAWLEEMLPLDDERRLELQIHLALVAESAAHPELGDLRTAPDDAVASACLTLLTLCRDAGLLRPGLDLDEEVVRLHVLVDGLALHMLGHPARVSPTLARRLLDEHLAARWRPGSR